MASSEMAPELPAVAERIRDEREWVGYSRAQVATKLRLPEATVEAFETGVQEPTDEQLADLAALFGLAPGRLRGEPLAADPGGMAILCGSGAELTSEDRYHVMRFAEFLRYSGRPPAVRSTEEAGGG